VFQGVYQTSPDVRTQSTDGHSTSNVGY